MWVRTSFLIGATALLCAGVARCQSTLPGGTSGIGVPPSGVPRAGRLPADLDLPIAKPQYQGKPIESTPPLPPEIDPPQEAPPTFFGEEIDSENDTIVYVLDISGSMGWDSQSYVRPGAPSGGRGPRIERAKAELIRSITGLSENFSFNVLAYDCSTQQWKGAMQQATSTKKADASAWVEGQRPTGATGTGPAVAAALGDASVMAVVLLTDGSPNCGARGISGHRRMIANANTQGASVSVFGIAASGHYRSFCQGVAGDNTGTYVDVP